MLCLYRVLRKKERNRESWLFSCVGNCLHKHKFMLYLFLYCVASDCACIWSHDVLVYCTSNGTQFFVFKILHEEFFTLKICIAKPYLNLNFGGE